MILHLTPRHKPNWIFVLIIAFGVVAWTSYAKQGPITAPFLAIAIFCGFVGGLAALIIQTTIGLLGVMFTAPKKAGVLGMHEYELRDDGFFERTAANEQLARADSAPASTYESADSRTT